MAEETPYVQPVPEPYLPTTTGLSDLTLSRIEKDMRSVGIVLIIIGIFDLIIAGIMVYSFVTMRYNLSTNYTIAFIVGFILQLIVSVIWIAMGNHLRNSAKNFYNFLQTRNIGDLNIGLEYQRKFFFIMMILAIIALVALVAGIILAFLGWSTYSGTYHPGS